MSGLEGDSDWFIQNEEAQMEISCVFFIFNLIKFIYIIIGR